MSTDCYHLVTYSNLRRVKEMTLLNSVYKDTFTDDSFRIFECSLVSFLTSALAFTGKHPLRFVLTRNLV